MRGSLIYRSIMEEKISSAYRAFRGCAYRNKYEKALLFGGKSFTYGALLVRAEYAYNSFCQMGVEQGERVALWLPDCPDLLASFYGLSRLGAVGVLIHPASSPREVKKQMQASGADILLTTAGRYELYQKMVEELPQSNLILCRPELDMKGKARKNYLQKEWGDEIEDRAVLDRMMAENRYNAMETPAGDFAREAVMLFGTSCFIQAKPITYLPEELDEAVALLWQGKEAVKTVYVENSFATEGGFLAVHGALTLGKTLLWGARSTKEIKKSKPDFLVATEEFFWSLRQNPKAFGTRWRNLQGCYQMGKELTPIMQKFTTRSLRECGSQGALEPCPIALKVHKEKLCFVGDFGVRPQDMEAELLKLPAISACKVLDDGGNIRLKLVPNGKEPIGKLGKSIALCCRQQMNPLHLPKKVEFTTTI